MKEAPSRLVLSSDLLILITIHLNILSYSALAIASIANSAYWYKEIKYSLPEILESKHGFYHMHIYTLYSYTQKTKQWNSIYKKEMCAGLEINILSLTNALMVSNFCLGWAEIV